MSAYPRDLVGYGAQPPDPAWPNGARTAVQFVVNYEEGAERCVLHGDAESEAFLSEMVGTRSIEGERCMQMESLYEYGARAGFWRLHRMLTQRGLPVTVFGVAMALARNPDAVAAMKAADWEIASHGLRWIDYQHIPEDVERDHIAEAIRIHTEVTGARPLGWYQGRTSPATARLIVEEGGFVYDADSYADDLPYYDDRFGRSQLIVPYTLDANDMKFAALNGFTEGEQFFSYLRDSFDQLHEEGGRMMSVGLHCRLAGKPARARALARFLDHLRAQDGVWVATRLQIAQHWQERFPEMIGLDAVNALDIAEFTATFGTLYEHSPWIAEQAAAARPFSSLDAMRAAFSDVVRRADTQHQLALVRAHPELGNRAGIDPTLTDDSRAEQGSAGLDRLSPAEYAHFRALNDAYAAKFAMPFIVCVRRADKAIIMDAMARRLHSDPATELAEALAQIDMIASLRLSDRVHT